MARPGSASASARTLQYIIFAALVIVAASSGEPPKQRPAFVLFGNVTLCNGDSTQLRIVHLRVNIEGQRWSWSLEMNKTSSYAFKYEGSQSLSKRGMLTVRIPHGSKSAHVISNSFAVFGVQRLDVDERDIDPEYETPVTTISIPETSGLVLLFDGPAALPVCAGEELTEGHWPMSKLEDGPFCPLPSISTSLVVHGGLMCEWRDGQRFESLQSVLKIAAGLLIFMYLLLRILFRGAVRRFQTETSVPCSSDIDTRRAREANQAWSDAHVKLFEAEISQPACFYYRCSLLSNCTIETKGLWNRDYNGRLVRP